MNQELILILKQIANSRPFNKEGLCEGVYEYGCTGIMCRNCITYPDKIKYQPYAIDLGEPNE